MLPADHAKVEWNSAKKHWEVRIDVGEEVIKRTLEGQPDNASEAALKDRAIAIAIDEGYQLNAGQVEVEARVSA